MDNKREIVCRRVEFVIHQALGNIQGADVTAVEASFCDKLMHADTIEGNMVGVAQSRQQVIGVQYRVLRNILESVGSMHGDVGKGAHKTATEVALEGFHTSDGFCGLDIAIERRCLLITFFDDIDKWLRQEICEMRSDTDRTHARSATAMWDRKGLMQVE